MNFLERCLCLRTQCCQSCCGVMCYSCMLPSYCLVGETFGRFFFGVNQIKSRNNDIHHHILSHFMFAKTENSNYTTKIFKNTKGRVHIRLVHLGPLA